MTTQLRRTALYDVHAAHEARFGPFAGWEMPLSYAGGGPIVEHLHTRSHASLFDVSHMGVIDVVGDDPVAGLELLVPGSIATLEPGRCRYTFFTGPSGGILDDVIVTRHPDRLTVVANAARVDHDLDHLRSLGGVGATLRRDLHLVALQGPEAEAVLIDLGADLAGITFMQGTSTRVKDASVWITRTGYTGEDGFELALGDTDVLGVVEGILDDPRVRPAGLAARDSLRLEAGLPLHGQDIDERTSPVEAGLAWAIPRRRREEGNFPGAESIATELEAGPIRRLVGLAVRHRRPVRPGYEIRAEAGGVVGSVTSGGFGPTVEEPVALGYVVTAMAEPGTRLTCDARGTEVPLEVVELPFVPHRYRRS